MFGRKKDEAAAIKLKKQERVIENDRGVMDLPYLLLTVLLVIIGLIMLFSASFARAYYITGNSASYFTSQAIFAVLGIGAMYAMSRVPYEWYYKLSRLIYGGTILLLLAVLLVGTNVNGATRWINLGFTQLQPSEIAKLSLIISLSVLMTRNQKDIKSPRTFFACAGALAIIALLLIAEPHFSATIIIALLWFCMMAIGGTNRKYLGIIVAIGAAGLLFLLLSGGYTSERITAWRNPEADPLDSGLQILQSEYAIGSGGLLGLGFGKSRQKYLYLPEEHNDYIFAIVCEELGFIGAVGILILFALLIIRGYWIAMHARDRFSMLLAAGLTTLLAIQVVLNVAVVTNLLPATGISLPFFSSGGTALIMQLAESGIMLNISRSISHSPK
ncbi:MAG: putative lipid II flippase FtsW [Faecousia sp.]|nr:putative lipid II flippase FtsW [Bacillota bacterium]